MNRVLTLVATIAIATAVLISASSQSAPAADPAKKIDFPAKGKTIRVIVPYAAGGSADIPARVLTPLLEKELGIPIEVVNKPGAGAQLGILEFVKSKADGYTIGMTVLPGTNVLYIDKERGATFGRKNFLPLAQQMVAAETIVVRADSPYKTMKDLVSAAAANPGKLKCAVVAVLGDGHLGALAFQKAAGIKLGFVTFDGSALGLTALLGGNVDLIVNPITVFASQIKAGQVRVLGIMSKEKDPLFPTVDTLEAQGYKAYMASARGYAVPAGTPKEVVDILESAFQKAVQSDEHKRKLAELLGVPSYLSSKQFSDYWDGLDGQVASLVDEYNRTPR